MLIRASLFVLTLLACSLVSSHPWMEPRAIPRVWSGCGEGSLARMEPTYTGLDQGSHLQLLTVGGDYSGGTSRGRADILYWC